MDASETAVVARRDEMAGQSIACGSLSLASAGVSLALFWAGSHTLLGTLGMKLWSASALAFVVSIVCSMAGFAFAAFASRGNGSPRAGRGALLSFVGLLSLALVAYFAFWTFGQSIHNNLGAFM